MAPRKKKYEEKPLIDQTGFMPGLMPPFSEEAEMIVCSSLLFYSDTHSTIFSETAQEWFYFEKYGVIFKASQQLFTEGRPIDLISVKERLKKNDDLDTAGGILGITQLGAHSVNSENIDYYVKLIHERYISRDLIRIANDMKLMGYNPNTDAFEALDYIQGQTFTLMETLYKKQSVRFDRLTYDNIDELSRRMENKSGITGIPTGFYQMDDLTSGWQKQALIIVGARPAMGKTALALFYTISAARAGFPVAFFSLEMSAQELTFRLQSMESEIEGEAIRSGRISMDEFHKFRECSLGIVNLPIYIDDSPGITIFQLRAKVRRMIQESGIKLVIIDYLQLMSAGDGFSGNREQEISAISRNMKALAKECDIPIIALSQLNRSVETRGRGGSIPMLSDLRESGAIEQDADMVIFPHRPEYYKEEVMSDGETPAVDMAEIHISKHRNGRLGVIMTRFEKAYTRFAPYTKFRPVPSQQSYESKPTFTPSTRLDDFTNQDNSAPF